MISIALNCSSMRVKNKTLDERCVMKGTGKTYLILISSPRSSRSMRKTKTCLPSHATWTKQSSVDIFSTVKTACFGNVTAVRWYRSRSSATSHRASVGELRIKQDPQCILNTSFGVLDLDHKASCECGVMTTCVSGLVTPPCQETARLAAILLVASRRAPCRHQTCAVARTPQSSATDCPEWIELHRA